MVTEPELISVLQQGKRIQLQLLVFHLLYKIPVMSSSLPDCITTKCILRGYILAYTL